VDDKIMLAKLTAEHDRLRELPHELDVQAETVDGRLVQIERELPDDSVHPDDQPQADQP
jgi:hypothetical protein